MRRSDSIKQGTEQIGNQVTAKVAKNKLAPPFKKAEFDIIFGKGISKAGNVLDLAVAEKLVQKAGSWYTRGDEKHEVRRGPVEACARHRGRAYSRPDRILVRSEPDTDLEGFGLCFDRDGRVHGSEHVQQGCQSGRGLKIRDFLRWLARRGVNSATRVLFRASRTP